MEWRNDGMYFFEIVVPRVASELWVFEIIINVPASYFRFFWIGLYLCYGSTAVWIIFILEWVSAQHVALREINVDTLVSNLTRRGRH